MNYLAGALYSTLVNGAVLLASQAGCTFLFRNAGTILQELAVLDVSIVRIPVAAICVFAGGKTGLLIFLGPRLDELTVHANARYGTLKLTNTLDNCQDFPE